MIYDIISLDWFGLFQAYMQINQLFADKTMEAVKLLKDRKQDVLPLIWIHDYHLTLAAKYIRKVFFFWNKDL